MKNLRGFNLDAGKWEPSFLKPWNANLIRFGININKGLQPLEDLDWFLEALDREGLKHLVIPVLYGDRFENGDDPMFYDSSDLEVVKITWRSLAFKYKGHPRIAAFDLWNEPAHRSSMGRLFRWNRVVAILIEAIRAIDPERGIIIEPLHGKLSELKNLVVIRKPKIWYSPHMYVPQIYTHQGRLQSGVDKPIAWNDRIKFRALRALKGVSRWQALAKAKIFIGEFSATRWADGAEKYLKTCIDYFEANNWPWCYHTLWASNFPTNPEKPHQPWDPNAEPNPQRKEVLLKALRANGS